VAAQGLGREHRPLSEINVTPFVDVMLVLLIIFMVTAPMMQQGLDVDLPETTTQPMHLKDDSLVLTVKKDGTVLLANAVVPPEELGEKLKAVLEGRESDDIFLRADKEAPYGAVVKVMAAARAGGAKALGVVTEPE
jgi:biopolymer transport protein TolR